MLSIDSSDMVVHCIYAIPVLFVIVLIVFEIMLEDIREAFGYSILVIGVLAGMFILYFNCYIGASKLRLLNSTAPYYTYGRYTADDLDKLANTFNTTKGDMKVNVLYDLEDTEEEWYEVRYTENEFFTVTMLFQHKRKGDKLILGTPSLVAPNN